MLRSTLPTPMRLHQVSLVMVLLGSVLASQPTHSATLPLCFTPDKDCTVLIACQIDQAKSMLLVQVYGFTSHSLPNAACPNPEQTDLPA